MFNEDLIKELQRLMDAYGDYMEVVLVANGERNEINTISYNANTHCIELNTDTIREG